jgi:D-alanyl-D-alanine carboxypeptidase (penicillin-binding protein 5/6)
VLIDGESGEVLFGKNEHDRCVPSSMTKIMTAYLVFSALKDGTLRLDDELPVSEAAQRQEGSRSFFQAGHLAKVEDLLRSVIIQSGNDACVVLAEKMYGDERAFAKAMNEKVAEFGLRDTNFMNTTGLPEENHYASVHDLAIISRRIIEDFPQYYHYFAEKTFTVNDITQQNRNTLLGNAINVDGLKTGKTNAGGFGIVASAKKNEKRLIVVVNGCKSSKARAVEANRLLALGFQEFIPVKISDAERPIGTANVLMGKRPTVNLYTKDSINISIPRKHKASLLVELNLNDKIEAPIAVGMKLGTLVYKYANFVSKGYDLYAHDQMDRLDLFGRLLLWMNQFAQFLKQLIYGKNPEPSAEVYKPTVAK